MDRHAQKTGLYRLVAVATMVLAAWSVPAPAQVPVDEYGNTLDARADDDAGLYAPPPLTAAELSDLVGPVALYPDDLLAIVLPASTYPLEIVQAARFLEQYEQDSTLKPSDDWDESVTALLNYPEVLRMMDEDIDWTWQLGDAVVNQQADVISAVESFRDRAYAAGNLKTDQYQTVNNSDGIIEIVPIDDQIIYVPYYEPERVLVRQVTPVYYYYPRPYPVYYYPYPVGYSFYNDFFWGVTTAYRIGWSSHNLHVHHYSYWGHPYYGHSYYGHYYRRPSVNIYNSWYVNNSTRYASNRYRDGDYWRPRYNGGARPGSADQRTRSYRSRDVARADSRDYRQTASTGNSQYSSRVAANRSSSHAERTTTRSTGNYGTAARQEPDRAIRFRERPETRDANRSETQNRPRSQSRSESGTRPTTPSRTVTPGANGAERTVNFRTRDNTGNARPVREAPVRLQSGSSDRVLRTARNATPRESGRTAERVAPPQEARQDSRPAPRQESRPAPRQEPRSGGNERHESTRESNRESTQRARRDSSADKPQTRSTVREATRASRNRN